MTQTIDTNVLVHGANRDSQYQEQARSFIERIAAGPELVVMLWPAILGFMRITTHPGIFTSPLSHSEASDNMNSLLERPHVRVAGELEGFGAVYQRVTRDVTVRGNLVPDAHIVALMHQHSLSTIWTSDRDFRKFEGIDQRDPLT